MILKINNGTAWIDNKDKSVEIMNITREDLLQLLHIIYSDPEEFNQTKEETDSLLLDINSPVEQEVTRQIFQKFRGFAENVDSLRYEVDSKFPNQYTDGN